MKNRKIKKASLKKTLSKSRIRAARRVLFGRNKSISKIKRNIAPKARKIIKIKPTTAGQIVKGARAPLTIGLSQREIAKVVDLQIDKPSVVTSSEIKVSAYMPKSSPSPFVLNLSELAAKRQREQASRHKVRSFFETSKAAEKSLIQPKNESAYSAKRHYFSKPKKQNPQTYHRQFTEKPWLYHWGVPFYWRRALATYVAICCLVVLPIKSFGYYRDLRDTENDVKSYAKSALADLKAASVNVSDNAPAAEKEFASAYNKLALAEERLKQIDWLSKAVIDLAAPAANISDAEHLLRAGQELSSLGRELTATFNALAAPGEEKLTARLAISRVNFDQLGKSAANINWELSAIGEQAVPEDLRADFVKIKKTVSGLNEEVGKLAEFSSTFSELLGAEHKKRYLIVFQNSHELRPTGGFIGSYALMDIDRGEITNLEIPGGGTYDLQGSLLARRVSPYPLQLVNALWETQDANWFPDFPASAEKLRWFYEESGGPTVDGVVAINSTLLPKILELTGPVFLSEYKVNLTSANVLTEIQKAVEFDYDKQANKPKQLLADMAPLLLEKMFALRGGNLLMLLETMRNGLNQRDIQLYFTNEEIENRVVDAGWAGEIKNASHDYLMVNNANIRGGKTDQFINQKINLVSQISDDGKIINTLTITRKHNGSPNDLFGKTSNISFVRAYVPAGSQLISADGFSEIPVEAFEQPEPEWLADDDLAKIQGRVFVDPNSATLINNEFGKTVFGNWLQVDAGEEVTAVVRYSLPFKFSPPRESLFKVAGASDKFYSLYWQKQSGAQNTTYDATLVWPADWSVQWASSKTSEANRLNIHSEDGHDNLGAFILK